MACAVSRRCPDAGRGHGRPGGVHRAHRPAYEAQVPHRQYFVRAAVHALPRVHLHAVVLGGALWRNHLAFRDALRQDAPLADQYTRLKTELAVSHAADKSAYPDAKAAFIRAVLARASAATTRP